MKKRVTGILSFIISVTLIIFLLSFVDLKKMLNTLMAVRLPLYCSALVFYLISYIARALRLNVLLGTKNTNYFFIISGHMFLNHFMPFRTGELSLPFFLKRIGRVSYSESISFVVLLRMLDVLSIIFTFLILSPFIVHSDFKIIILLSTALFVIGIVAVCNLKALVMRLLMILSKFIPRKFSGRFEDARISISRALTLDKMKIVKLSILSLFDRACSYIMSIFLVLGMSYQIPLFQLIVANASASITNIIPVNSIGSFGTLEAGWAGVLVLFGVQKDIAVSSGFNFHLLALTFTIVLGLISLIVMNIRFNINPFKIDVNSPFVK